MNSHTKRHSELDAQLIKSTFPEPQALACAMKRGASYIRFLKSALVVAIWAIFPVAVAAQEPAPKQVATDEGPTVVQPPAPMTDPYDAVSQGNQLLKDGKAADALEKYELAKRALPDAREIAFAEGLSEYHLGDYERARNLFREAAGGKNDALADDATYSLGTTYHSDALLSKDDPKAALSNLEQAMEYYQTVLSHDPDHAAANDGYRKAGATWRQIKQQMQQQPQQQQSSDDKNDNNDEQEQNDQQKNQSQDQSDQKDNQQQNQQNQDQQQQDNQQDQQESDQQQNEQQQPQQESDEQQDEQQSSSDEQDQQEQQEPQEATADQKDQVSREQAERKLREMMQAMRERKERRREQTRLVPVRPVDKDW